MKNLILFLLASTVGFAVSAERSLRAMYTFKNVDQEAGLSVTGMTSSDYFANTNKINATAFADGVKFDLSFSKAGKNFAADKVEQNLALTLKKESDVVFTKAKNAAFANIQGAGLALDVTTAGHLIVTWDPDNKNAPDGNYMLEVEYKENAKKSYPFTIDTTPPTIYSVEGLSGSALGDINAPFADGDEVSDRYVKFTVTFDEEVTAPVYGTSWFVSKDGEGEIPAGASAPTVEVGNNAAITVITIDNGEEYTDENGVRYQLLSEDTKITDLAGNPLTPVANL